MQRSDSIIELTKALVKVQAKMKNAKRESENPVFSREKKKATYADMASVLEAARDPLAENGLAVIQPVDMDGEYYYIDTMLLHTSGEYISSRFRVAPMRQVRDAGWVPASDPQAIGSAIQYGRRYAFLSLLCMATEDDDGNAASGIQTETKKAEGGQKEQSKTTNFEFLKIMKAERDDLGDANYYEVLKSFNFAHSNEILKKDDQIKIYKALKALKALVPPAGKEGTGE